MHKHQGRFGPVKTWLEALKCFGNPPLCQSRKNTSKRILRPALATLSFPLFKIMLSQNFLILVHRIFKCVLNSEVQSALFLSWSQIITTLRKLQEKRSFFMDFRVIVVFRLVFVVRSTLNV